MSILLSTDNGFIVKHTSPSTDAVVWTGGGYSGATHSFEDNITSVGRPGFATPQTITSMPNTSSDYFQRSYTLDGGDTWTEQSDLSGAPAFITKDATYSSMIDENGYAWGSGFSGGHRHIYKSTDRIQTAFTDVFDFFVATGSNTFGSAWVGDGYFWWARDNGTVVTLHRLNLDGTNHLTWTYTTSVSMRNMSLNGWHGTKRLVYWEWLNVDTFSPSHYGPIVSIDLTDPDNPTFTDTGFDPFGTDNSVWDVYPLTNQIIIANAVDDSAGPLQDLQGSIWRSTDGGASWTQVVATTTNLGGAPTIGGFGADNEINAIAIDPTNTAHVVVALCPPYIYESFDSGATWTVETVDMSLFDPYLTGGFDVRPQEWCGVCVSSLPVFPGLERLPEAGVDPITGARWGPPLVA